MGLFTKLFWLFCIPSYIYASIPLFFWMPDQGTNLGDIISKSLVEEITQKEVQRADIHQSSKFLAIGSIIQFAQEGDIVWGSGIHGKHLNPKDYAFKKIDVRSVRGPLSRDFLMKHFHLDVPEIYGDPALLIPYFFPQFKVNPKKDFIIIPHISEISLFEGKENVVMPNEPWEQIVQKITEARFVIASSLHGIVVAEAFGIPTKMLRITQNETLFKYADYYLGTGRETFQYATSIEEALMMGGEPPPIFDPKALLRAFPEEFLY